MNPATADARPAGAGLLIRTVDSTPGSGSDIYLLHKRGPDVPAHPATWGESGGGRIRDGEDPADGAVRRYHEEMGHLPLVQLRILRSTTVLRQPGSDHVCRRFTLFLATASRPYSPEPPDHRVVLEWGWFTLRDLPDPLHPEFADELAILTGYRPR